MSSKAFLIFIAAGASAQLCSNECTSGSAFISNCDDGGPGSEYALCDYGTDCDHCGPRYTFNRCDNANVRLGLCSSCPVSFTTDISGSDETYYQTIASTRLCGTGVVGAARRMNVYQRYSSSSPDDYTNYYIFFSSITGRWTRAFSSDTPPSSFNAGPTVSLTHTLPGFWTWCPAGADSTLICTNAPAPTAAPTAAPTSLTGCNSSWTDATAICYLQYYQDLRTAFCTDAADITTCTLDEARCHYVQSGSNEGRQYLCPPPSPSPPPPPPAPSPPPPSGYNSSSGILCDTSCVVSWNPNITNNGRCDDGGSGATHFACDIGTDCDDCGPRSYTDVQDFGEGDAGTAVAFAGKNDCSVLLLSPTYTLFLRILGRCWMVHSFGDISVYMLHHRCSQD